MHAYVAQDAREAALRKKEAELAAKERALQRRERELGVPQKANWPICMPVWYHSIADEIPVGSRRVVREAYVCYLVREVSVIARPVSTGRVNGIGWELGQYDLNGMACSTCLGVQISRCVALLPAALRGQLSSAGNSACCYAPPCRRPWW
jgi:hypothetical protein